MDKDSYPREEMDLKLEAINQKIDRNHKEIMRELSDHEGKEAEMLQQVKFTNGKVRMIIKCMIGLGAFTLGLGIKEINTVIGFFLI